MDRRIIYAGAVPLDTDLLETNRNVLIGLGLLTQDIFGTATVVGGLPCTATSPASLNVEVGPGRIYSLEAVDENAYGSLAVDTVDQIIKQGINLASTEISCPAPTTAGQSIDYLIEGKYEEDDTELTALPYYNASNPANPWSGPENSGTQQATTRAGVVTLQAKAGIPAATGSQTVPAVDSGYVPLYVVTVAFGQTTITASDISVAPGAPFISGALLSEATADARYLQLAGGTLTGPLVGTSATLSSVTVNGFSVQNAAMLTSGLLATARIGTGTASASTFARGDQSWAQVAFSNLSGSIANGQVPSSAVTQWQASLSITGTQVSGAVAKANTIASNGGYASFNWSGQSGQPSWLWGSNDGLNFYVWNPANFSVSELQGYAPSAGAAANTVALRDANGYLWVNYLNQASAQNENPAISQVMVTNNSDNFLRKAGLSYFERSAILGTHIIAPLANGVPALAPGQIAFLY